MRHIGGRSQHIIRKAAIGHVSAIDRFWAQRLPSGEAPFTLTAGRAQPRQTYTVSFFDIPNIASDFNRDADSLVAGNKRKEWFYWPVPIHGMQICMAYARRLHLRQNLAWTRVGKGYSLEMKRLLETADKRAPALCRHSVSGGSMLRQSRVTQNIRRRLAQPFLRQLAQHER